MELTDRDRTIDLLNRVPGIARLLEVLAPHHEAHLVGGPVRDLLLGHVPLDLDLVVEGDALALAVELAAQLGGESTVHERFGTASIRAGELRFDLASARTETYAAPGALPDVAPGSLWDDLHRRDLTINAMALALARPERGTITAHPQARDDLRDGVLRVLHDQSFTDDPTRLLRLARYAARLRFAPDEQTAALVAEAARDGALSSVSGPRRWLELSRLLEEESATAALELLVRWGLAGQLGGLTAPHETGSRLPAGVLAPARPLALLALALRTADPDATAGLLDDLGLLARERDAVLAAAFEADDLVRRLATEPAASRLAALLRGRPPEVLAVVSALGAADPVARWLDELRHVRPAITGEDLLAAGVAQGPALGRALRAALDARLDGRAEGREAELAVALEAVGDGR